MKCDKCKKREATTHLTRIVNGYKEEYHLCSECAANSSKYSEIKNGINLGIGSFLPGIFSGKQQGSFEGDIDTDICPTCNMPYSEFLKKGKLGCGDCYLTFKNRIKRPIKQIHGTFEHIGKAPKRGGEVIMLDKKIANLEAEMYTAVQKQDFEAAARLRDEIKALKTDTEKEV